MNDRPRSRQTAFRVRGLPSHQPSRTLNRVIRNEIVGDEW